MHPASKLLFPFCGAKPWVELVPQVVANVYLDIRTAPDVNAERTGESLVFGEQFQIDEVYRSAAGRSTGPSAPISVLVRLLFHDGVSTFAYMSWV